MKVSIQDAPWDKIADECSDESDIEKLSGLLLEYFKISKKTLVPEKMVSFKPFVLLFDEYYTDIYRMAEAEAWMKSSNRIIFLGTSFSVNITSIALNYAELIKLILK